MSEDDVADMLDSNELSERFMDEDDGQPSWSRNGKTSGKIPGMKWSIFRG